MNVQTSSAIITDVVNPALSTIDSNPGDDSPTQSSEDKRVDVPLINDVLCGRGGSINSHKGNEQFRSLVESKKRVYLTARFKREKRLIASSIVNQIRGMNPPGRFLARKGNKDSGYWYDIGDEKARDKTSQALRENAPSIRADIETEIHQKREELRRKEETPPPKPASTQQMPYAPVPIAAPAPPILHAHSQSSYASYVQQYYDYYYHYYGYGAPPPPPPPPPPGFIGGPPQTEYPAQPPQPYWEASPSQKNSNAPAPTKTEEEFKEDSASDRPKNNHSGHGEAQPAAPAPLTFPSLQEQSPFDQEEADHRMAMVLQQQENARAFEDRNRRYGSDRKASRSAAFCAPGYRPRLLNDRALDDPQDPGILSRKRPAMSASHLVSGAKSSRSKPSHVEIIDLKPPSHDAGAPFLARAPEHDNSGQEQMDHRIALTLQEQEDKAFHSHVIAADNNGRRTSRSNAHPKFQRNNGTFGFESMVSSSLMSWSRGAQVAPAPEDVEKKISTVGDANMNHKPRYDSMDLDQKPASSNSVFSSLHHDDFGHQHIHDHSLGSLHSISSKGRTAHAKDDSDLLSLFGEGSTLIPLPHSHGSQRVRDASVNSYTPIAFDNSQNSSRSRLSQFERKAAPSPAPHNTTRRHQEPQDPSILSQVAQHILGTFGSSWADPDTGLHHAKNRQQPIQQSRKSQDSHREAETETEMGQEVVMDVRDESNMPPFQPRGSGAEIDWPSQAGCHSWIPETFGANAAAFFGSYHSGADKRLTQDPDHSLTRQNSYSRADISPVNSMDMDFSQYRRQRVTEPPSLMNVFDSKQSHHTPEDMLQQVPSWERSYRSRSPTLSLVDMGGEDQDDSLIRVNSYDIKETLQQQTSHSSTQMMPPPAPVNHHHQYHSASSAFTSGKPADNSEDMGMDWEGHAGE